MYGMVMNAIEQMAKARLGDSGWRSICESAGLEKSVFLAMSAYPDEVTFALAGATAEALDLPMATFLEEFGRFWIPFARDSAYGPMLRQSKTLLGCLERLDQMHSQIGRAMPHLKPPSFAVESDAAGITVRYFSERQGLTPFVLGLLHGLADLFSESVEIRHVAPRSPSQGYEEFRLEHLAAAPAPESGLRTLAEA